MKISKNKKDNLKSLLKNSKVTEREKTVGKREKIVTRREAKVTKAEEEEEERKEAEAKYGVLFTFSRDAIMTLEPPSWKFNSGNFAAIKMFNIKYEKDFISLGITDLSPEKQPDGKLSSIKAKKMIEKAMKEGVNFFGWTFKRYGGENFPATVLLSRVKEKEKTYLEATIRDITELKKAEEKLKELDIAKTNFMNTVSHELKTPLTAIYANLELLEEAKDKLSEKNVNNLNALRRNSNQLRFLIDNLLEIARIQSNRFELNISKIDLKNCIKFVENDLKVLADKKNIKLIIEMDKPIKIITDGMRLAEILTNLVDNAIKFTEKGYVKVKARKQDDHILLEIIDTGIGISEDRKSKIFEQFYKISTPLKSEFGATGVGLSIAKQMVELLGGKIDFKSKSGKGSVFYFTLPIKYKEAKLPKGGVKK